MQQQLVAHPVMPDVVVGESTASAAPLSNQSSETNKNSSAQPEQTRNVTNDHKVNAFGKMEVPTALVCSESCKKLQALQPLHEVQTNK
jgi:hypothetical protein